jgi:FMN phosphatase YigB (HAD superfamily)
VAGAKALGIPVLWLNRGGRALPEGHVAPDYVAPDLTGLLEVLSDLRDL